MVYILIYVTIVYPIGCKSAYFNKHGKIEAQYLKKDYCKGQGQGQVQGQG